MDTSETYIKMCEGAEEIQKVFSPPFHMMRSEQEIFYEDDDVWLARLGGNIVTKIWLPRQDQLQEMIGNGTDGASLLFKFYWWFDDAKTDDIFHETWLGMSMEQLWLAFVMKEKYGKVWDGERWVSS